MPRGPRNPVAVHAMLKSALNADPAAYAQAADDVVRWRIANDVVAEEICDEHDWTKLVTERVA